MFSVVTNGGGSGVKFFKIILFQHGITSSLWFIMAALRI